MSATGALKQKLMMKNAGHTKSWREGEGQRKGRHELHVTGSSRHEGLSLSLVVSLCLSLSLPSFPLSPKPISSLSPTSAIINVVVRRATTSCASYRYRFTSQCVCEYLCVCMPVCVTQLIQAITQGNN